MTGNRIDVLLVEDDTDSILLMNRHLAAACGDSLRFQMECAGRVQEAVDLLGRNEYDVLLLDLMLPDSEGLDGLRRIRARAPNLPIVVLTGLSDEELALEALAHGAQDFLFKDRLEARTLRRAISYAIERSRLMSSWENILLNAADAMVVVDDGGLIRYVNPAAEALLRKRSTQLVGRPFGHPVVPGKTSVINLPVDGAGERVAEVRVTEIEWRRYRACLASIRDITDLRRLEQLKGELRERRRLELFKEQWLNTVTHEFRSPLGILRAAHAGLRKSGGFSRHQQRLLELARRNVERLSKLVTHLEEFSGLAACRTRISRRRLSAGRIIQENIQAFQLLERRRDIAIEADLEPGLPPVHADADMVSQVLCSLLDHALHHARSRVTVRARAVDDVLSAGGPAHRDGVRRAAAALRPRKGVHISVIDDGPGLRVKDPDSLLDPDQGGDPISQGSPAALSVCKDAVEQLQGRIWLETSPGRGTQAHFTLPQYE